LTGSFGGLCSCSNTCNNCIIGTPHVTLPVEKGKIIIRNIGEFEFEPAAVSSVRPDLFKSGYISLFDLLVHLSNKNKIKFIYHFDQHMDTCVIENLNGTSNWWYQVWYDGGWPEESVHRMDYYPVKDKMNIEFMPMAESEIQRRYEIWQTEVKRRATNNGKIIIPKMQIRFKNNELLTFENLLVSPHNLRSDMLVKDIITAADIILALGDQGKLSYNLLWYENIGAAEIKNYYVEGINGQNHSGRCGFVYEVGELEEQSFSGNHIHLHTDLRILQSPQYVLFFWIELGPCGGI
jgi:hypothetical protein